MPLISEKVRKNAEKCRECGFLKIRNVKLDKNSFFVDGVVVTIEGIYQALEGVYRSSCAMCPYEKDFEKVYGMKPYEYFPMKPFSKKKDKE